MTTSTLKNDRLLKALACEPLDQVPIWMMRQAGRYLPEYRTLRAQVPDFMTLCKTPELACEVTLQPLRRFALDAAILFSDILTIPDAMGLGLEFVADQGPVFHHPLREANRIKHLRVPDPEKTLRYVPDTIRLVKQALQQSVPLIGFSGSPWTLACYMIEGGSSKEFQHIKKMAYAEPKLLHQVLKVLAEAIVLYAQAQLAAGIDVFMIFDTWGGLLAPAAYREFSLHYMQQIIAQLPSSLPVILFTKGGGQWLEWIAQVGCQGIGLDWTVDLSQAITQVPAHIALQGNLDPSILLSDTDCVIQHAKDLLAQAYQRPGYIFNLGHGILPITPIDNVVALVNTVHSFRYT